MVEVKILIVDDEEVICEMIFVLFELVGFKWMEVENGLIVYSVVVDDWFDLILLDWMFLGVSGIELVCRLKCDEVMGEIFIIMFIVKSEEDNKIQGLDVGVDDYIIKFFFICELIFCINVVLCCIKGDKSKVILVEGFVLDFISYCIIVDEWFVEMGFIEYCLLEFFMIYQDWVYFWVQLLDQVWGGNVYVEDCMVDVYICRFCKVLVFYKYDYFV